MLYSRKCHIRRNSYSYIYIYVYIDHQLCVFGIAMFTMGLFSREAICLIARKYEKLSIKTSVRYALGFSLSSLIIADIHRVLYSNWEANGDDKSNGKSKHCVYVLIPNLCAPPFFGYSPQLKM